MPSGPVAGGRAPADAHARLVNGGLALASVGCAPVGHRPMTGRRPSLASSPLGPSPRPPAQTGSPRTARSPLWRDGRKAEAGARSRQRARGRGVRQPGLPAGPARHVQVRQPVAPKLKPSAEPSRRTPVRPPCVRRWPSRRVLFRQSTLSDKRPGYPPPSAGSTGSEPYTHIAPDPRRNPRRPGRRRPERRTAASGCPETAGKVCQGFRGSRSGSASARRGACRSPL